MREKFSSQLCNKEIWWKSLQLASGKQASAVRVRPPTVIISMKSVRPAFISVAGIRLKTATCVCVEVATFAYELRCRVWWDPEMGLTSRYDGRWLPIRWKRASRCRPETAVTAIRSEWEIMVKAFSLFSRNCLDCPELSMFIALWSSPHGKRCPASVIDCHELPLVVRAEGWIK